MISTRDLSELPTIDALKRDVRHPPFAERQARAKVGVTSAPNTTTALPRAIGDFLPGAALRYLEKKPFRDCDFSDFVFDFLRIPAAGGFTIRVLGKAGEAQDNVINAHLRYPGGELSGLDRTSVNRLFSFRRTS